MDEYAFRQNLLISVTSQDNDQRKESESILDQFIAADPLNSTILLINFIKGQDLILQKASLVILTVKIRSSNEVKSILSLNFFEEQMFGPFRDFYLNAQTDSYIRENISYLLIQCTKIENVAPIIFNLFLEGIQTNDNNIVKSSIQNILILVSSGIIPPSENQELFQNILLSFINNPQTPPEIHVTLVPLILVLSNHIDMAPFPEYIYNLFNNLTDESLIVELFSVFETYISESSQFLASLIEKFIELFIQLIMKYQESEKAIRSILLCLQRVFISFSDECKSIIEVFITDTLFPFCLMTIDSYDPSQDASFDQSLFMDAIQLFEIISTQYAPDVEFTAWFISYLSERNEDIANVKCSFEIINNCYESLSQMANISLKTVFYDQLVESLQYEEDASLRLISAKFLTVTADQTIFIPEEQEQANEIMNIAVDHLVEENEKIIIQELLNSISKYGDVNRYWVKTTCDKQKVILQNYLNLIENGEHDILALVFNLFYVLFSCCSNETSEFVECVFNLSISALDAPNLDSEIYLSAIKCATTISTIELKNNQKADYFNSFIEKLSQFDLNDIEMDILDEIDTTLSLFAEINRESVINLVTALISSVLQYLQKEVEVSKYPANTPIEDLRCYCSRLNQQENVYYCSPINDFQNISMSLRILAKKIEEKLIIPELLIHSSNIITNKLMYVTVFDSYDHELHCLCSTIYGLILQQIQNNDLILECFKCELLLLNRMYVCPLFANAMEVLAKSFQYLSNSEIFNSSNYFDILTSIEFQFFQCYNHFVSKVEQSLEMNDYSYSLLQIFHSIREIEKIMFVSDGQSWISNLETIKTYGNEIQPFSINPSPTSLLKWAIFVKTGNNTEEFLNALLTFTQFEIKIDDIIPEIVELLFVDGHSPFEAQLIDIFRQLPFNRNSFKLLKNICMMQIQTNSVNNDYLELYKFLIANFIKGNSWAMNPNEDSTILYSFFLQLEKSPDSELVDFFVRYAKQLVYEQNEINTQFQSQVAPFIG